MRHLLLILALCAFAPTVPASPTEAHPDCESGQPWIGYVRTDPVREAYHDAGAPGGLAVCEGEHWDGQDPLAASEADCTGEIRPGSSTTIAFCLGTDPNDAPGEDLVRPAGARASHDGDRATYAAANVALVGRVALYADPDTLGVYYRDNTPGNIVWTLVHVLRLRPPVAESDCSQDHYQQGAYEGFDCHRDNTAVTIEHRLLA